MRCLDTNKKINYIIRTLRDDFLSLINLPLTHVYCSTTLSNHRLIRLKNSSREIVAICVISYFFNLYLILHTCVKDLM